MATYPNLSYRVNDADGRVAGVGRVVRLPADGVGEALELAEIRLLFLPNALQQGEGLRGLGLLQVLDEGGDGHRRQDGDDGNDDHELHQRETRLAGTPESHHFLNPPAWAKLDWT